MNYIEIECPKCEINQAQYIDKLKKGGSFHDHHCIFCNTFVPFYMYINIVTFKESII